jgi:hypothetical protein
MECKIAGSSGPYYIDVTDDSRKNKPINMELKACEDKINELSERNIELERKLTRAIELIKHISWNTIIGDSFEYPELNKEIDKILSDK